MSAQPVEAHWIADVSRKTVRWFISPCGYDIPWCDAGQVLSVLGLKPKHHAEFLVLMRTEWCREAIEVLTDEGPAILVPYWCGRAILIAGIQLGKCTPRALEEFETASRNALTIIIARLSPAELDHWNAEHDRLHGQRSLAAKLVADGGTA